MKFIKFFILVFFLAYSIAAQKPDDVLAKAAGHTFRVRDLSAETQATVSSLPTRVFAIRAAVLDQIVNERLLDAEAKILGVSAGKLLASEKAKIAKPTEVEIKAVYDANRQALGDLTFEQARPQIVGYLRSGPEKKAFGALFERLKIKHKYVAGKGVNSPDLAPTDVVATINLQPITAREFEDVANIAIYELRVGVSDVILADLNETIYNTLTADEAKSLGIDASTFIAREVTNKLKDYSDEERGALESALVGRLAAKYKVSILYKTPDPAVQNISADDDPATGPADAAVTIVMFSDFQCSACSAAHPVLKKVMDAYPGKIRFVVRDFPLESIHENGFKAAVAAGAANAQGKFFEYIEILYKHQDALDAASLKKYAADLGLNAKQFELDFNSAKTAAEVRKDMADGESYVVNSTPTIFVNGVRVRDLSAESFKAAIDRAILPQRR